MKRPLVTLTSDFGEGSPYVACMKGVLRTINPLVELADITHAVAPQNVRHGAFVLCQVVPYFPPGTIHVAVVDPGVGTQRKVLLAEMDRQRLVAPDNGLLSWLAREHPPTILREVTEERFWRVPVSSTFHGRDIMAPVAAHVSLGVAPEEVGPALDCMQQIPWPDVRRQSHSLEGVVLLVDSFGNLVTNITLDDLQGVPADSVHVTIEEHETVGIFRTYGDTEKGTLMALVGSSDLVEIAVNGGSAAKILCVGDDTPVTLHW